MKTTPEIADIIELQTWAADKTYSLSSLTEDLDAAVTYDDDDQAERQAQEVFDELASRAKLLGPAYPFSVDGVTISPSDRAGDSSYLFCLGLTWLENITNDLRSVEFEAIVKRAAEGYFGGQAVRIGAPWRTAEITTYGQLLQKVSDLIPDLGPPTRTEAPAGGDAGWDIVVVNNFADLQYSRIIALGNCATGRTNWLDKGLESQPTAFWDFFTRQPQALNVCLTFIAVPFLMDDYARKRKVSATCIAFDRLRICEHSPSGTIAGMDWLNGERNTALDLPIV